MKQHSLGKEAAIKLFETKWWEGKAAIQIAEFQLFTAELCCPFSIFHQALAKCLDRPVFTHELANVDNIIDEFLGHRQPPSFEDIINLIPEDKRIIVITKEEAT